MGALGLPNYTTAIGKFWHLEKLALLPATRNLRTHLSNCGRDPFEQL